MSSTYLSLEETQQKKATRFLLPFVGALVVVAAVAAVVTYSADGEVTVAKMASEFTTENVGVEGPFGTYYAQHSGYGPETVKQISGYIPVNKTHGSELFYWFFESRNDPKNDPLVLWLTGGPGCSSMMALFTENGPYHVADDGSVTLNEFSWNEKANVIFLDQPVGTGFSYANVLDYDVSEEQIATDMYVFLVNFLAANPQYADLDFHISGESYAGHYIPALGSKIVKMNADSSRPKINLKGLAIGNGWVDPKIQYGQYPEYAYDNKLIGSAAHLVAKGAALTCQGLISTKIWPIATSACNLMMEGIMAAAGGFNQYDIRKKCEHPPLCYDFSPVEKLLDTAEVKTALGVDPKKSWTSCNMAVHTALLGDWMTNLDTVIPDVLSSGVKVLVYSGDKDFICNYYGGREWTNNLKWAGKDDFSKAQEKDWEVDGTKAGVSKSAQGLTFLQVFDAGHMVPMDQPKHALDMINRLISGEDF